MLRNVKYLVKFEVFTAVTMKNAIFWDVTPPGSCKTHTRATRRDIPEDAILHVQYLIYIVVSVRLSATVHSQIRNILDDLRCISFESEE
jgi:hypothetical protein